MYLQWGDYRHASNSVALSNVTIRPKRTPRGRRVETRVAWRFMGELLPDQASTTPALVQSDLDAKCYALIRAYEDDYKDIGFYKDDGSLTSFYLSNGAPENLTGNLVEYCTFPHGEREEYAGKRTFSVGVYADFADTYSQLLDYSDTIQLNGDGGPVYNWQDTAYGPKVDRLYPSSYVTYVHSGYAVAFSYWPIPPLPLASGENYMGNLTTIRRTTPKKYAGNNRWGCYKVEWRYVYKFAIPQGLLPVIR